MSHQGDIQKFFDDSTVFLTGATGFVGKLVLEKILRACPVKQIYVLMRMKKGKNLEERFAEIFTSPAFGPLKEKYPGFMEKVFPIYGDCSLPNLGLSDEDINILKRQVNCVIHCAATVRFDEALGKATKINVRGTRDLLKIARDMENLKAFVYVSTAYSNCNRPEIDEIIYKPTIDGHALIAASESLSEELLSEITPRIVGDFPNTYTLTKHVTEDLIRQEAEELPICIVRPSIIIASAKEPVCGFIDTYYGPSGMLLGCGVGLWRSFLIDDNIVADFIPVDYVVNFIIASAWYIGTRRRTKEPMVFNCVSFENARRFANILNNFMTSAREIGSVKSAWYPVCLTFKNHYLYLLMAFLLHTVPAVIIDSVRICMGKNLLLIPAYKKIHKFGAALSFFSLREWYFSTNNLKRIRDQMSRRDRELFNFDILTHNWDQYYVDYIKGARIYLLKDPAETFAEGKKHFEKLKKIHYTTCVILIVVFYYLVKICLRFLYRYAFGNK